MGDLCINEEISTIPSTRISCLEISINVQKIQLSYLPDSIQDLLVAAFVLLFLIAALHLLLNLLMLAQAIQSVKEEVDAPAIWSPTCLEIGICLVEVYLCSCQTYSKSSLKPNFSHSEDAARIFR